MEKTDPYGNYEWLSSKRRRMESVGTIEGTKSSNCCPKGCYKFKQVIKPQSDKRSYRVFTLENKIKVVVISDPDSVKSACALSVQAGSMSDPKEYPGMAHLCERMLFTGAVSIDDSDVEDGFDAFLHKYDGEYSSFTQRDLAVHVFDVNPVALHAALDRFSRYFIAPTFPKEYLEEAIDGIQAECESRAQNDDERRALVAAMLTKSDHPFSRFDCGNRATLWNKLTPEAPVEEILQSELTKFFNDHYSANLMSVAILGVESCDDLQKMAENIFEYIPNSTKPIPRCVESPYGPEQFMTKIEIVPLQQNLRKLFLIFPIPDFTKHYKTGAIPYLRYILGYEGPGSLITSLKRQQLIKKLEVDYEQPGIGFAFITLDFELTIAGQQDVFTIITLLFQYVQMVRKEGPQRRVWEEMKMINETKFRFLPQDTPMNYTENLVTLMPVVPQEEILSCRYLLSENKLELIRDLFNFINPTRMRLITTWPENLQVADEVDEWFGCKYKYSTIEDKLVKKWQNCSLFPDFKCPPPNPFIATTFDLKARDSKAENNLPRLIEENALSQVWFLQDSLVREPKATIILHVVSHLPKLGPSEYNLTRLMAKIVEDALSEFSSAASAAGLTYNVEASINGFTTTVHGYDHKLHILFNYVLNRLFHFVSFGNVGFRFEAIKSAYIEELQEWMSQEPYVHASEYVEQVLNSDFWSVEELLASMNDDSIPPSRLVAFSQKFFSHVKLNWFFHGNYTEKESLKICQSALDYFRCVNSRPIPVSKFKERQDVLFESGSTIFEAKHTGCCTTNSASSTAFVLQTNLSCVKDKVIIELIESILYDPAYNIIPGKDKLVWTDIRKSLQSLALIIVVQAVEDVHVLEEAIETFLRQMTSEIKKIPHEEFLEHRVGLAMKKTNKYKSLWDRGVAIFQEIYKETYDFDNYNLELRELQKITQDDLCKFYQEWISPTSEKRKKICINVVPNAAQSTKENPIPIAIVSKDGPKFPRENLYTAVTSLQNNSIFPKWTPTLRNSLRNEVSTRGSTALNSSNNNCNTEDTKTLDDVKITDDLKPSEPEEANDGKSTGNGVEGEEEDLTPEESSEESDESSDSISNDSSIKEYYNQIEKEIKALSSMQQKLLSEIKARKSRPPDHERRRDESSIGPSPLLAEGGEARPDDNREDFLEKDVEANIEFERRPLPLHLERICLPAEYNVYTLTSIETDSHKSSTNTASKGNNKKLKNKLMESSEDETSPAKQFSKRQSPQSNPSHRVSRAKLAKESSGLKEPTEKKTNSRSRPSSHKNTPNAKDSSKSTDSKHLTKKSESRVPDKKSDAKVGKKPEQYNSESEPMKQKNPKKAKSPTSKPLQEDDTSTETLKRTISEMDDVEEIEELDFDIQKEILRLQKLRQLLDAKARRILSKEDPTNSELASKDEQRTRTHADGKRLKSRKTREAEPTGDTYPSNLSDNTYNKTGSKTKVKAKKPRTTTLYKCLQELRTNLTDEEYKKIIDASEEKLKATIQQYKQGPSYPKDANENMFMPVEKDGGRRQELMQWLRGVVVEEETENIKRSMLRTRKEIDCLNNTYMVSAILDSSSNSPSFLKAGQDASPLQKASHEASPSIPASILTSSVEFPESNICSKKDISSHPKVTLNKPEMSKLSQSLVRRQSSLLRKLSNRRVKAPVGKTSKNGSSPFKENLKPFHFGRISQQYSQQDNSPKDQTEIISEVGQPQPADDASGNKKSDMKEVKGVDSENSFDDNNDTKPNKAKSPTGSNEDSNGDSSSADDQVTRKSSLKNFQFNVNQKLKNLKSGKTHPRKRQYDKGRELQAVKKFQEDLKASKRKNGNNVKKSQQDRKTNPKYKIDDMSPKEFGMRYRREIAAEKKKNLHNDMAEFKNVNLPEKDVLKSIILDSSEDETDPEDQNNGPSRRRKNSKKNNYNDSEAVSTEIIAPVKSADDQSSTESVVEDTSKIKSTRVNDKVINDIRQWRKTMQMYAKRKSLQL